MNITYKGQPATLLASLENDIIIQTESGAEFTVPIWEFDDITIVPDVELEEQQCKVDESFAYE